MRNKGRYNVKAIYTYDDDKKHRWSRAKSHSKEYANRKSVVNFIKEEIARARVIRCRAEEQRAKGQKVYYDPYTVTFKVMYSPLVWTDVTHEWEDELTLVALGGELK